MSTPHISNSLTAYFALVPCYWMPIPMDAIVRITLKSNSKQTTMWTGDYYAYNLHSAHTHSQNVQCMQEPMTTTKNSLFIFLPFNLQIQLCSWKSVEQLYQFGSSSSFLALSLSPLLFHSQIYRNALNFIIYEQPETSNQYPKSNVNFFVVSNLI